MENKIKLLIAIGAAVTANCQPCLETAVGEAQKAGLEEKGIREAVAIGRFVRKGAVGKIDKLASVLIGEDVAGGPDDCPFGTTEEEVKEWIDQGDECVCG